MTDTASLSPILAALHAYCRRDGLVNYQAWQREPFPSELDGHRWLVATNWTCLFAVLSDERVPPTLAVPPEHKPLLRSFLTPPAAVRRAEVLLLSELRAWAGEVPPPPPPPPDCAKCKNIGSVQCSRCEGEGECSCDCGDQHDCGKCNGNGYIDCGCAWKAKAVADKKEEVEQGTLLGIVFDRCLFREALSIAPCEQITVYAPADPERHPTLLSCDGWRLAVMPLHALTPKDGAWPRL